MSSISQSSRNEFQSTPPRGGEPVSNSFNEKTTGYDPISANLLNFSFSAGDRYRCCASIQFTINKIHVART